MTVSNIYIGCPANRASESLFFLPFVLFPTVVTGEPITVVAGTKRRRVRPKDALDLVSSIRDGGCCEAEMEWMGNCPGPGGFECVYLGLSAEISPMSPTWRFVGNEPKSQSLRPAWKHMRRREDGVQRRGFDKPSRLVIQVKSAGAIDRKSWLERVAGCLIDRAPAEWGRLVSTT